MENIIEIANQFIIEQNICSLPVNLQQITQMLKGFGFSVLSYNQAEKIMDMLGLKEYSADKKAFTVVLGEIMLVTYRDNLSLADKLFSLAHELGHIVLGHINIGVKPKENTRIYTCVQEREADNFAYQILAPLSVLKHCKASYFELSRVTLLSGVYAENVFARMSSCNVGISDQILIERFYDFIRLFNASVSKTGCKKNKSVV